jgi:hypothetical protein
MRKFGKYTIISFLLFVNVIVAQEILVLQQGLNGYDGCKNLGIYDNKYPNKNYAKNYTYQSARKVMISKFKC